MSIPVFFDVEFRDSREPHPVLIAAVILTEGVTRQFWLWNAPEETSRVKKFFETVQGRATIVCYNALAEARCISALGLDPLQFEWIDLMVLWRLYKNEHPDFPKVKGTPGGDSFLDCQMGLKIAPSCTFILKETMRALILTAAEFSSRDRAEILAYCSTDVTPLPAILTALFNGLQKEYGWDLPTVIRTVKYLSLFVVAMSKCEDQGIPLRLDYVKNLSDNYLSACDTVINTGNAVYPFYEKLKDKWTGTYKLFWEYVNKAELRNKWKTTPTGRLVKKKDYLEKMAYLPEIKQLLETQDFLTQIRWFRPTVLPNFYEHVGNDGSLRPYFNPFGTVTGRNAPPAKTFLFAMSKWLRALCQPPPGQIITELDYANQEFYIAAVLSKDPAMLEAYLSGDFYMYFAHVAGAVPDQGTMTSEEYAKTYAQERQQYKSTVLGLQYGMGREKLSLKLTSEMGVPISIARAEELISIHKSVFRVYWGWLEMIEDLCMRRVPLVLADGWAVHTGAENKMRTYKNFMSQGTGACILRNAVIRALNTGLRVIAPVHDSIIITHSKEDTEAPKMLRECMEDAVTAILGTRGQIRIDEKQHLSGEMWVDKRSKETIARMSKYLTEVQK
jgi:DNA polymerase I-like protein with 3'-5' exonuclease and polymerase domains